MPGFLVRMSDGRLVPQEEFERLRQEKGHLTPGELQRLRERSQGFGRPLSREEQIALLEAEHGR